MRVVPVKGSGVVVLVVEVDEVVVVAPPKQRAVTGVSRP
jgi:hypothetical protein